MKNEQKKLKVLILIRNFDFGGAENHVCALANELCFQGNEVWIVSGGGRQLQQMNNDIHHIKKKFCDQLLVFQIIWLIMIIYREKFDVIHAHQRIMILAANIASIFTKTPVVATVHGRIRYDLRSKFVRRNCAGVIAICENSLVGMRNDPLLAAKSVHIPNGIRVFDATAQCRDKVFRMSYISRIDQRHYEIIRLLIREVLPSVIAKNPNSRFLVAGGGPYMTHLLKFMQSDEMKMLSDYVHIEGYVSDLQAILNVSNLVFGVGRVALEAIAAGVPVFSIKNKRMGEIIRCNNLQHFQFGNFVDLDGNEPDAKLICRKISEFITNEQFYKDQSQKIRQEIKSVYRVEAVAATTEKFYESLINNLLQDKINHEKIILPSGDFMPDYANLFANR